MPSWSGTKGWVRMMLFSLAFVFFVIGLARPQIGAKLSERKTRGAEVVICLDVSQSMLAQDYSPNRLERAKLAIARITDRLQDDRIGLVLTPIVEHRRRQIRENPRQCHAAAFAVELLLRHCDFRLNAAAHECAVKACDALLEYRIDTYISRWR